MLLMTYVNYIILFYFSQDLKILDTDGHKIYRERVISGLEKSL